MPKPRPADVHFALVDREKSIDRLERALEVLVASGIDFVVEGGWAVAAYGSAVPSVDLDVLVPGGLSEPIGQAIEEATGLQIFSHATTDSLALDFVDADRPNGLIHRPSWAYVPSELLRDRTEIRQLMFVSDRHITVPNPAALVFMKLKAFHDRSIQWRAASGERHLLMTMSSETQVATIRRGADHWLRKAGKDLYDISWLVHEHTHIPAALALAPPNMREPMRASLGSVPAALVMFAEDMGDRAQAGHVPIVGRDD